MSKVNTVLGPVSPESLGVTLVHEHCAIGFSGWECDPLAEPPEREETIRACLKALEPARACGLESLIEATPPDLSRDEAILKEVSERAQINIICSTGRYTEGNGRWAYLNHRSKFQMGDMTTELYEGFMKEITVGIGRSGIRAGAIKVATSLVINPWEEATLRAAARASRDSGVPILTHTEDGVMAIEQAEILLAEGADPGKIMIGHVCGNPSARFHKEILQRGVNIAYDRFGLEFIVSDTARIASLVSLLGEGYAEKVMISHDYVAASFGRTALWPDHILPHVANWSYVHIFRNILPALRKAGVGERDINTLMVENPRRLLG